MNVFSSVISSLDIFAHTSVVPKACRTKKKDTNLNELVFVYLAIWNYNVALILPEFYGIEIFK